MGVSIKLVLLVIVLSAVGGSVFGAATVRQTPQKTNVVRFVSTPAPLAEVKSAQTQSPSVKDSKQLFKHADFSFAYPQNIQIVDITPPNDKYNSMLRITSNDYLGEMRITVTKTSYKSVDEWVFKEKFGVGAQLVGATKLSSTPSKQYRKAKMLYTIGLADGYLYTIEGPSTVGWADIHDYIVANFTLGS